MLIAAENDLTLELSAVTAFASGLLLQLAMKVTGIRAEFARYETRPLTDPHDWSARWSYLAVRPRLSSLSAPARIPPLRIRCGKTTGGVEDA